MADPIRNYQTSAASGARVDIDQGLRAYMIKVYNLMGLGLLITGIAAWGAFQLAVTGDGQLTAFGQLIYASAFRWVVILAPLAAVMFLSFRIQSMSVAAAQTTFWVYAG
ncbi:MAG: BAX inhibitor (BI)-1/YccA family protein, partial [Mesorhizobium sp.]